VGGLNAVAEEFVYDASYVKLREVVLAYQLPSSLLGTLPVRSARVSVFGRNLALLHKNTPGFDPSAANFTNSINRGREAFAFPSTRSIGAGLKVQF
jgi:flagellar basal body rod protein FlgB